MTEVSDCTALREKKCLEMTHKIPFVCSCFPYTELLNLKSWVQKYITYTERETCEKKSEKVRGKIFIYVYLI